MKIQLYDDGIGSVDYISHMGDDLTVVNSARVSFGVEKKELDDKDKKLIRYLIKHKHTSTLEHNLITFRFTVPLFIRSQHHRHRTWSYNEISRRYTDVNINFYEPQSFRSQHKSNRQASNPNELSNPNLFINTKNPYPVSLAVREHHEKSLLLYSSMIEAGVCREQARGVLPQNMYTQYYGTTNLNNLMKFIELRTHDGAQWEIKQVALACLEIAKELYPITVGSYIDIRNERS
ncbi:MAG: FAD-dependent thymidylate synthase [Pseudomonadota bacterium]|nr:FAD-dependent thymidylate synthase [Pseudomonadota bacterium]